MNPSDRQAFIRAVCAAPDDDLPRLIFADALDACGDPLGEFIRVQCELARPGWEGQRTTAEVRAAKGSVAGCCSRHADYLPCDCLESVSPEYDALRRRERVLLDGYGPAGVANWYAWSGLKDSNVRFSLPWYDATTFRRGFVAQVATSWELWSRHAAAILAACPIRHAKDGLVRLTTWPDDLAGDYYRGRMLTERFAAEWPGVRFELPRPGGFDRAEGFEPSRGGAFGPADTHATSHNS